nr:hypothetical protein [Tanacetum cinerariifolium]
LVDAAALGELCLAVLTGTLPEFVITIVETKFLLGCRAPRSQGNKNGDITKRVIPVATPAKALVVTNGMGYDWSYQVEEGPTNFALMAFSSLGSSSSDTKESDSDDDCKIRPSIEQNKPSHAKINFVK